MWGSGFGAIGLSLSTDKRVYTPNEAMRYLVTGAVPGSTLAWSSFRDGISTGEILSNYAQSVDANGTADFSVTAPTEVGGWLKVLTAIDPSGGQTQAQTSFQVVAAQASPTPGSIGLPSTGAGFFEGSFDIAGFNVPKIAVYAVVAFFLLKKGKF